MKRIFIVIIVVCFIFTGVNMVDGNELKEKELYRIIFTDKNLECEKYFHESFLKIIPEEKVYEIVKLYQGNLGKFLKSEKHEKKYELSFEKGTAPSVIELNEEGKIISLWLGNWKIKEDNLKKIQADLDKSGVVNSVCIMKNGKDIIHEKKSDEILAVGSSFKLYILKALENKVNSGSMKYEDIVRLSKKYYSLPTGILQNWEEGTPVTVNTLANLMISISDNTATDHLLNLIGRKEIEKLTPGTSIPLLSTMEMFKMKFNYKTDYSDRYIKADLKTKYKILDELEELEGKFDNIGKTPKLIKEIEWHFSTKELCRIIYELRDNSSISINLPGLKKEEWKCAGYKGGSEPGVINMTFVLQRKDEDDYYSLSVTVNNYEKSIDSSEVMMILNRFIDLIKNKTI